MNTGQPAARPWEAAAFEVVLRRALLASGSDPAAVATFSECGYDHSRYGLRLALPAGAAVYLQIVAARPPDPRSGPEGSPPPRTRAPSLPGRGRTALTLVELHLVAALTALEDRRIRWVEPFSTLKGSIPFGLRVVFHCGATVCCYLVHAVPAGSTRPHGGRFPSIRHI